MEKSADLQVQNLLDVLNEVEAQKYDIVQACREAVFGANLGVAERIMYGGIMFSLNGDDFGGLFASKKHISFEFTHGVELDDPKEILEGTGKLRRHIKLKEIADVKQKMVGFFVEQLNLKPSG